MDPTRLMSQTATITSVTNSASVDEYGNPTESTATTNVACYIAQARRFEDRETPTAEELWTGWFPAGTSIDAGDRVAVGGRTYGVDGPPWVAVNARTGDAEFVEATLRRTS